MKKCLYGMLRYERETVDISRGSGVMRHGSDATRGVRATVQRKREINYDETRGRGVRKWNGMKMI